MSAINFWQAKQKGLDKYSLSLATLVETPNQDEYSSGMVVKGLNNF